MTIWIKQGVLGTLNPYMMKAKGKLVDLYSVHGSSFYITSVMEGNHRAGSYHYEGGALDFKRRGVTKEEIKLCLEPLEIRFDGRYDVIEYPDMDIFHVEFDPI